jgi:hypothetical protein
MSLRDMMGRPGVVKALDRATIVIHGDHGARIDPPRESLADAPDEYLLDHLATLFAVREPQSAPGYDLEVTSLQELFHRKLAPDRELRPSNAAAGGAGAVARALEHLHSDPLQEAR